MTPILIDVAAAKRDRPDLNFEQVMDGSQGSHTGLCEPPPPTPCHR